MIETKIISILDSSYGNNKDHIIKSEFNTETKKEEIYILDKKAFNELDEHINYKEIPLRYWHPMVTELKNKVIDNINNETIQDLIDYLGNSVGSRFTIERNTIKLTFIEGW